MLIRILSLFIAITLASKDAWLGSGPFCDKTEKACTNLNLEFLEKSGLWCLEGWKVHCRIPAKPEPKNPLVNRPADDSDLNLNVISLKLSQNPLKEENIDQFGKEIPIIDREYDGHIEKTCLLPHYLKLNHGDADVVALSGSHLTGCIEQIKMSEIFNEYGWQHAITARADGYYYLGSDIFSKLKPTNHLIRYFVNMAVLNDTFSYGYQLVDLEKNNKKFKFLYARFEPEDAKVREAQVNELVTGLKKYGVDKSTPVLYQSNYIFEDKSEIGDYFTTLKMGKEPVAFNVTEKKASFHSENKVCGEFRALSEWEKGYSYDCARSIDLGDLSDYKEKAATIKFAD